MSFEEWWGTTCASAARNKTKCRLKETAYAAWNHQQAIIDEKDSQIKSLDLAVSIGIVNSCNCPAKTPIHIDHSRTCKYYRMMEAIYGGQGESDE